MERHKKRANYHRKLLIYYSIARMDNKTASYYLQKSKSYEISFLEEITWTKKLTPPKHF